jgi:hypothetical protein
MSFKEYLNLKEIFVQDEESIREEPQEIKTSIQVTGKEKNGDYTLCHPSCKYLKDDDVCKLFNRVLQKDKSVDYYRRVFSCYNIGD